MDESVQIARSQLKKFRLKELKDVLSRLGIPKQGKKQDLLDRLEKLLLTGFAAANLTAPKVIEIINDVFRSMHTPGPVANGGDSDPEDTPLSMQVHHRQSHGAQLDLFPEQQGNGHRWQQQREGGYAGGVPGGGGGSPMGSPPNHVSERQPLVFRMANPNARKEQHGARYYNQDCSAQQHGNSNSNSNGQQQQWWGTSGLGQHPGHAVGTSSSGKSKKHQPSSLGTRIGDLLKAGGSSGRSKKPHHHHQLHGEVRCVCGKSRDDVLVQCQSCRILEHAGCVLLPPEKEKGKDGQPVPSQEELRDAFRCELCRLARGDPFSVPVANPLLPRLLKREHRGMELARQTLDLTFSLSTKDFELLRRPSHVLQVYCVLMNDRTPNRMHWPAHPDLFINSRVIRVTGRPGQQLLGANGRDEGPPIGDVVQQHFNRLTFTCQDARPFVVGVRIVRLRTYDEVMAMVPPLDEGETLEDALRRIERCLGPGKAANGEAGADTEDSEDLVVMSDAVTFKLDCPMSGMRVKEAGRFHECQHMGCFDLPTLVQMNKRARKWQCPVCMKLYSLESLIVDAFFQRVCQQMAGMDEEVKEVELKAGGFWRPKPLPSNKTKVEFPWRDIRAPFSAADQPVALLPNDADEATSGAPSRSATSIIGGASLLVKPEPWAASDAPGAATGRLTASTSLKLGVGDSSTLIVLSPPRRGVEVSALGADPAHKRRRTISQEPNGDVAWVQGGSARQSRGGHASLTGGLQGERSREGSRAGAAPQLGGGHEDAPIVLSDSDDEEEEENVPLQQVAASRDRAGGSISAREQVSSPGPSFALSDDTPPLSLGHASLSPLRHPQDSRGSSPSRGQARGASHLAWLSHRPTVTGGGGDSEVHQRSRGVSPLPSWGQTGSRGQGGGGLGGHGHRGGGSSAAADAHGPLQQFISSVDAALGVDTTSWPQVEVGSGQEQEEEGLPFAWAGEEFEQTQGKGQRGGGGEGQPLDLMAERWNERPDAPQLQPWQAAQGGEQWLSGWRGSQGGGAGGRGSAQQRSGGGQGNEGSLNLLLGVTGATGGQGAGAGVAGIPRGVSPGLLAMDDTLLDGPDNLVSREGSLEEGEFGESLLTGGSRVQGGQQQPQELQGQQQQHQGSQSHLQAQQQQQGFGLDWDAPAAWVPQTAEPPQQQQQLAGLVATQNQQAMSLFPASDPSQPYPGQDSYQNQPYWTETGPRQHDASQNVPSEDAQAHSLHDGSTEYFPGSGSNLNWGQQQHMPLNNAEGWT